MEGCRPHPIHSLGVHLESAAAYALFLMLRGSTVGRTSTVLYRAQYVKIQEKKKTPNLIFSLYASIQPATRSYLDRK